MKRENAGWFVAGVLAATLVGGGTAFAATGGTFLLGRSNTATTLTTLSNSEGTALRLNSKAGTAPLGVNSTTRVPNLNADRLDGLDSTALALKSGQSGQIKGASDGSEAEWFDHDMNGTADSILAFATCPAGTVLTGGGFANSTSGELRGQGRAVEKPNTWFVFVTAQFGVDQLTQVQAWAQCYNPRGAVPGA